MRRTEFCEKLIPSSLKLVKAHKPANKLYLSVHKLCLHCLFRIVRKTSCNKVKLMRLSDLLQGCPNKTGTVMM